MHFLRTSAASRCSCGPRATSVSCRASSWRNSGTLSLPLVRLSRGGRRPQEAGESDPVAHRSASRDRSEARPAGPRLVGRRGETSAPPERGHGLPRGAVRGAKRGEGLVHRCLPAAATERALRRRTSARPLDDGRGRRGPTRRALPHGAHRYARHVAVGRVAGARPSPAQGPDVGAAARAGRTRPHLGRGRCGRPRRRPRHRTNRRAAPGADAAHGGHRAPVCGSGARGPAPPVARVRPPEQRAGLRGVLVPTMAGTWCPAEQATWETHRHEVSESINVEGTESLSSCSFGRTTSSRTVTSARSSEARRALHHPRQGPARLSARRAPGPDPRRLGRSDAHPRPDRVRRPVLAGRDRL